MKTEMRYEKLLQQLVPHLDMIPEHVREEILDRWWQHEYSLQMIPRIFLDRNVYTIGAYQDCIWEPHLPIELRSMILSFLLEDSNQPGINLMIAPYQPDLQLTPACHMLRDTCLKSFEAHVTGMVKEEHAGKHFVVYECGIFTDTNDDEDIWGGTDSEVPEEPRQKYYIDYFGPDVAAIHTAVLHYLDSGTQPPRELGVVFHTTIPPGGFVPERHTFREEGIRLVCEFYEVGNRPASGEESFAIRMGPEEQRPSYRKTFYVERNFYMELRPTEIEPPSYHNIPIEFLEKMPNAITQKLRRLHHGLQFRLYWRGWRDESRRDSNHLIFRIEFRAGGYIWFKINPLNDFPVPKTGSRPGKDLVVGPRRRVLPFSLFPNCDWGGQKEYFYSGLVKYENRTWYFQVVGIKINWWGPDAKNGVSRMWVRQAELTVDGTRVFMAPRFRVSKNGGEVHIEDFYHNYFA